MAQDFSSFVERYQLIYEKDPNSKVFAPLAEAYRRMGMVEEAIDLAERGVKRHPNFASGRVALGKCFSQKGEHSKAVEQLEIAAELSPENLLAHQLLADSLLKLKKFSAALNSYKMILFLNPEDPKAAATVNRLEAQLYELSKDEWAEEDFSMEKLAEVARVADKSGLGVSDLSREIALLDSRLDRGDWDLATKQINELIQKYPKDPGLLSRKAKMDELTNTQFNIPEYLEPMRSGPKSAKVEKLESLLSLIETRRKA